MQQMLYQQQPGSLSVGQRWGTWALNTIIPGLGSAVIMDDYAGMGVQIGVGVLGLFLIKGLPGNTYAAGGLSLLSVNQTFNIIRSVTYEPTDSSVQYFSAEQRWKAWVFNIIVPGSGSAKIMKDYMGMAVQMILGVPGMTFVIANRDATGGYRLIQYNIGITCMVLNFVFNSFRTYFYGESTVVHEYSGLNLEFLPNRHGEIMPALMYRKAF
ncbi:hypothetical protein R83H12_01177 [Fibrobacteria bacterium R8-3-H12]